MYSRMRALSLLLPLLTSLACAVLIPATPTVSPAPPAASDTPGATEVVPPTETATLEPATVAPNTDTPDAPAGPAFLAYIQGGQLMVANVAGDALGGVTQYTQPGIDDSVYDLVWSPSGEFIAFTSWATGDSRLYVVYAEGAGTPVDLGLGSAPNWAPNSLEIAFIRDDNVWITTVEDPAPRPLTYETNWGWGRPTFTPDGTALIVTGNSRDNMGAQGNTEFVVQVLAPDGFGTFLPLPGAPGPVFGRLPFDLKFSPDGTKFAFSSSIHFSACATQSDYYVADADGSNLHPVTSPSLAALEDPAAETYHLGLSYDWAPNSQALLAQGQVMSCAAANAGTMLAVQVSLLGLDGSESFILPGFFSYPSYNAAGDRFAVGLAPDFAAPASRVHIYDLSGNLILDVAEGWQPAFQP